MKVLIADSSPVVRSRLMRLVSAVRDDLKLIACTGDARECHELLAEIRPDVFIQEAFLTDTDIVALTKRARKVLPNSRIVVFTDRAHDHVRQAFLNAGADNFFTKIEGHAALVETLRLPPGVPERLLGADRLHRPERADRQGRPDRSDMSDRPDRPDMPDEPCRIDP